MSIRTVAFSPLDPSTVYAGSGRSSAGFGDGGATAGLFRSTDLGDTWTQLARSQLLGLTIRHVVPTGFLDPLTNQEVVLIAASGGSNSGGVFRSDDAGETFTRISGDGAPGNALPGVNVTQVVADPSTPGRYFVGVPFVGVFRSIDYGVTWQTMSNGITDITPQSFSIDMAVHSSPGNSVIYAAVTRNDQSLPAPFNARTNRMSSLWRTTDGGQNWRQVQNMLVVNPGAQGGLHFSMVAHPTDPNVVFLGGDAPVPDDGAGGLNPFPNSYMSRYRVTMDDGTPANDTWTPTTDFNASGTRPHADARDAVFDSNGNLIEVDDGGIYRLVDPDSANRQWEPLNGNLRLTEFFSVAYDSLNDTLFGGTQDNGTPRQRATSDPLYPLSWSTAQGADGGVAGVDNDQAAHPGSTLIFTVSQNLGGFTRRVIDNTNAQVSTAGLGVVASTNGNNIQGLENAVLNPNGTRGTLLYMTPYAVNAVAPRRLVVGTNYLYESTDSGSTFTAVGGLQDVNGDALDNDNDGAVDEGDEFLPLNPVGKVNGIDPSRPLSSPIAYGGTADGVDNADVLWLGAGGGLRLRTTGNGLPAPVLNYTGGAVVDVVMDPEDWHTAFILDANGAVFRAVTNDAGTNVTFSDVTGDLGQLATSLRVLEAVRVNGNLVLLAGGRLGVYRAVNPSAGSLWAEFGGNLPNAPVNDIRYDAADDVLLVGTFGRGAWTIGNASAVLPQNPVLNICGDEDQVNQDDVFRLVRNAGNPLLLDVFINGLLSFTGPLAAIGQINVFGGGGNDNLIVDSTNGLINPAGGIRYDGDGKCPDGAIPGDGAGYDRGFDRLTLLQNGGPIQSSSTYWMGPQIGSGIYTIVGGGPGDTQTVFFEGLEPVIDVVPAVTHTINATPENNAIDYAAGPNSGIISLLNPAGDITGQVTVDNYEAGEFANKASLVINALAGDDVININLVPPPTGLSGTIGVDAGAPGGSDRLVVTGTAAAEAFEYAPNAPDGG
ncbi:MAG: hypothetical protein MUE50_20705, partial [Pirellulaceae bacterium]|nr:hypothetical protein [Pirellulaceae bacterium]